MRAAVLRFGAADIRRIVFVFACSWPLVDAILTICVLKAGGRELNPLLVPLLAYPTGVIALLLIKVCCVAAMSAFACLCARIRGIHRSLALRAIRSVITLSALVGAITVGLNVMTLISLLAPR